ncbi:MAG TPA: VanW family protein, partial [Candidatus Limiplasma sp.]|nr:VanW family protein [Candidatus Limiplasma sp.]
MYNSGNQPYTSQPAQGNQYRPYPPQGGRPQPNPQNGGYKPRKRKKRGCGWQITKLLLILLLVAAVGGGIYVGKTYLDVAPYTSVFLDGVTVDGIDLGGMTWDEGDAAVRAQIIEKLGSWYVRIKSSNGSYRDITAETLGISRDPADALEAAWAVGHQTDASGKSSIFEMESELIAAQSGAYSFSSVEYNADTTVIDDILAKLETAAYVEPQDAKMLEFNPDSSTEPFTFQEEVVGRKLNTEALKEEILEMVNSFTSGEVVLETETLYPSITVADLEQYYTLRSRAVTPIASSSTDARNENIKIAFSKINGYILNDGSKFSFNTVVGKRSQANGFLRAYEYNYGDLTWGI